MKLELKLTLKLALPPAPLHPLKQRRDPPSPLRPLSAPRPRSPRVLLEAATLSARVRLSTRAVLTRLSRSLLPVMAKYTFT